MIFTARMFAKKAHGKQKYGDKPYIYHLDKVANLLKEYGPIVGAVAYLHDVLEDTHISKNHLMIQFGAWVANNVAILSDEYGKNRKKRKESVNSKLSRIKVGGGLEIALIVKAADRLANLEEGGKIDMYRKEHEAFYNAVYRPGLCDEIWEKINTLLKE